MINIYKTIEEKTKKLSEIEEDVWISIKLEVDFKTYKAISKINTFS